VGDERLTRDLYKVAPYYFTNNYRDPIPSIGRKPFEHPGQVFDLSSALYASREIVYFKENHDYILFPDKYPSLDRKRKISRIQGSPQPVGLFRRNNASTPKFLMSPEWHFHNSNFYIAHTYSALIQSNFSKKSGTGIQPEFSKTELCITNDKRVADLKVVGWDGVTAYKLLKNDKQSYPFIQCQ